MSDIALGEAAGFLGKRLAGRAVLAPLGPLGLAIGGALLAYDAYELYKLYNESHAETDGSKAQDACDAKCQEAKEKQKEADEVHDNIEDYEGRDYDEVEKELDEKLRDGAGWKKDDLKKGDGSKYTSPNGNKQIRINRGYPEGNSRGPSDEIHKGPYLNRPSTGTRVPLKRPGFSGV